MAATPSQPLVIPVACQPELFKELEGHE